MTSPHHPQDRTLPITLPGTILANPSGPPQQAGARAPSFSCPGPDLVPVLNTHVANLQSTTISNVCTATASLLKVRDGNGSASSETTGHCGEVSVWVVFSVQVLSRVGLFAPSELTGLWRQQWHSEYLRSWTPAV